MIKNKPRRGFTQISVVSQVTVNQLCKYGFALMELLVAVLIVGVLAAVAVPMYKKAVVKSRFTTMIPLAKAIADAQEMYYLGKGDYAENLGELDVSIPGNPTGTTPTLADGTQIKLGVEENHVYVRSEKENNALMMYQKNSPNFAGETHCEAKQDNTLANWLCEKGLGGTFVGNKYGYAIYALDATDPDSTLGRIYYNKSHGKTYEDGDTCWSNAHFGCDGGVLNNYSVCIAESGTAACRGVQATNHSRCEDSTQPGCYWGSFTHYSVCKVNPGSAAGCYENNYTDHSVCFADIVGVCKGQSDKFFDNYSSCVGNKENTCKNTNFTDHSVCFANATGACANATYDETSCCSGSFCTEHQCESKPLTKDLTIVQPVYEEMITPTR